jgi:hypothetical protein
MHYHLRHSVSPIFKYLSNCHTVFYSCCTILQFLQQCASVPTSLYLHHHLVSVFWIVVILRVVRRSLIVVLICIFLVTVNIENHFICLLAIYTSVLDKCLLKSFVHFKINFLNFLLCYCRSSIYVLSINVFLIHALQIFPSTHRMLFILLIMFTDVLKF